MKLRFNLGRWSAIVSVGLVGLAAQDRVKTSDPPAATEARKPAETKPESTVPEPAKSDAEGMKKTETATPPAPAPKPKPEPVKYTELKKTLWPPKNGIKTPGVQIPMTSLKPEAEIAVPAAPAMLAFTDQVLIPIPSKNTVIRVNGRTNKTADPISGLDSPCAVANAFASLWVANCGAAHSLARLEPRSGKLTTTIPTGTGAAQSPLASTADSLWMLVDDKTTLARIDPQANAVVAEIRLPSRCRSVTFAEAALWVVCPDEKRILKINPQTNVVTERIEVTPEPVSVVFGEGSIWVLSRAEGKVARIDPKTNKVTATISLGFTNLDGNLAAGEGFIWVSAPGFPITKISPQADKERVVQQFAGEGGGAIQFGLGSIWLSNTAYGNVWRLDPKRIAATLAE